MEVPAMLRLAILTERESATGYAMISALCGVPDADVVAVVVASGPSPTKTRLRGDRTGNSILAVLDRLASRMIGQTEATALLKTAFPEQVLDLERLGEEHYIPIFAVNDLDGARAREILRGLALDLGVVLSSRSLKQSTFSVPRWGCVYLRIGKPPEDWGLYSAPSRLSDGQRTANVSVYFAASSGDKGATVEEELVSADDQDTPETFRRKLEAHGTELLARCVADLAWAKSVLPAAI